MKGKITILALSIAGIAASADAADISAVWNAQGNWNSTNLWQGGVVPGTNDMAIFKHGNLDITTPVTLSGANFGEYNTFTNGHLGKVNVISGGSLEVVNTLTVGARDGNGGEVYVNGGDVTANYIKLAGDFNTSRVGAVGTLNIYNGTVEALHYHGAGIGVAAADCVGTVNIYSNGIFEAQRILVGSATGATGVVNVVEGTLKLSRTADTDVFVMNNGTVHLTDGVIEWAGQTDGAFYQHSDIIQDLAESGDLTWGGTSTNMLFDAYTYSTNNGESILYSYDWTDGSVVTTYVWSTTAGDAPIETTLIDYQFNDTAGTQLKDLQNDGTVGAFDANATDMLEATGTGFLKWQNTSTNNGSWRVIDLGSSAVTKGVATLEWRLDSWSMTDLPKPTGIKMVLGDSAGNLEVRNAFEVGVDGDNVQGIKIRMRDTTPSHKGKSNVSNVSTNGGDGYVFRVINDLDAGTIVCEYRTDSGVWTDLTPAGGDGLNRIDWIGVQMTGGWTNNPASFANVDYLKVTHVSPPLNATEMYAAWLSGFTGMGSETNATDNPDLDAANNWFEYGVGGDPSDGNDMGLDSLISTAEANGTNYFDYVHVVRDDAEARGISYYLELSDNLTLNNWTNANYVVIGTNTDYAVDGFNQITNRVSTETKDKQFVRLIVE